MGAGSTSTCAGCSPRPGRQCSTRPPSVTAGRVGGEPAMMDIRQLGRRKIVALVLTFVLVITGAVWWWRAHRDGLHVRAKFTSAQGLYAGCDVRILGVAVGKVDSVTPHGTRVTVAMTLDPGISVRADTWALIVAPNLVSDRY